MITLLAILWIFAMSYAFGAWMTRAIIQYKKDTYYARNVERRTLDQEAAIAVQMRKYQRALDGDRQARRELGGVWPTKLGSVIRSYIPYNHTNGCNCHTNGCNCPACVARLRGTLTDQDIGYIDDRW